MNAVAIARLHWLTDAGQVVGVFVARRSDKDERSNRWILVRRWWCDDRRHRNALRAIAAAATVGRRWICVIGVVVVAVVLMRLLVGLWSIELRCVGR